MGCIVSVQGVMMFRRISSFEVPHATKAVRVLYGSGVHYDALDARL